MKLSDSTRSWLHELLALASSPRGANVGPVIPPDLKGQCACGCRGPRNQAHERALLARKRNT